MRVINKPLVGKIFLIVLVILGFHISHTQNGLTIDHETQPNVHELLLRIEGMTCKVCTFTIKKALKKLSGVLSAEVSYKDKEAKVLYEDNKVTTTQIIETIENVGNYKAVVIK